MESSVEKQERKHSVQIFLVDSVKGYVFQHTKGICGCPGLKLLIPAGNLPVFYLLIRKKPTTLDTAGPLLSNLRYHSLF